MRQWYFDLRATQKMMLVTALTLSVFFLGNLYVYTQLVGIGEELDSVVEHDMEMIESLSNVTVHQLEEVIAFEQALSAHLGMASGITSQEQRDTAISKFESLGSKVQKELKEVETLAQEVVGHAYSEAEKNEFKLILKSTKEIERIHDKYISHADEFISALKRDDVAGKAGLLIQIEGESAQLDKALVGLLHEIDAFTKDAVIAANEHEHSITYSLVVIFVCASIIALSAFLALGRRISRNLNKAILAAKSLSNGDFEVDLSSQSKDEAGQLLDAMRDMKDKVFLKMQDEAKETSKIKRALDVCDTNVMMADSEFNISYMNDSVKAMMHSVEADLRKDLPNFEASSLMGKSIDVFHKNPSHQRQMLESLTDTYRTSIVVGGRTFGLIATPITSESGEPLGTVVEWDDQTEFLAQQAGIKNASEANARIKTALDSVTSNVMMADADRNIIYANDAVLATLRNAQDDIRKDLPHFDVDALIGGSIDQFHKKPSHQAGMLDRLTSTFETKIVVGGRHMSLTANPVNNEAGERVGTVLEWVDETAEVRIENEIDELVTAANDGDLSHRLDLSGKEGFFKNLSQGLNNLMDKTASFVSDIGQVFESMAEGDLTNSVSGEYRGEFDQIKTNANATNEKLIEIVRNIQGTSFAVRTSANEVAQGSDDLSRRTESQASSLQQTAASMEEITATVKQSAENAARATNLASEAKQEAENGGEVVQNAVEAMGEILTSSKKINDIIGVIDEIAFQTNLLALNAAVEAARAGEQGRGFAVVAGEVRTLSQRSAAAAKEIKDLIRDSVNKVETGSSLVNQSGETLSGIVSAVERVATMIQDVSVAAQEQNSGIGQINQAITQMDEVTQQNAALVEETSAASRSMSEEATSMNNMINFFQVSDATSMAPRPPVGSAPASSVVRTSQTTSSTIRNVASVQEEPKAESAPKPAASSKNQSAEQGAIKTYVPTSQSIDDDMDDPASYAESDDWEDF